MEDVFSAGQFKYTKAKDIIHVTGIDVFFKNTLPTILVFFQLILTIITVPITAIYSLIFGRINSKKCIKDQVALITGGANGLGQAIAIELAKLGCNIVILDVDTDGSMHTCNLIKEMYNVRIKSYNVDVSDNKVVENIRSLIEKDIGPVDILINNAGLMPRISLLEGSAEDIKHILNVNVNSSFWTIRTFLGGMIKRKRGHIVGISSLSAIEAIGGAVCYTATKFANRGLMEAMVEELRFNGLQNTIMTTCVFSSFINTRHDVVDYLDTIDINYRLILYTPEYVAKCVVNGILENKRSVVIPRIAFKFFLVFGLLPYKFQDKLRAIWKPNFISNKVGGVL